MEAKNASLQKPWVRKYLLLVNLWKDKVCGEDHKSFVLHENHSSVQASTHRWILLEARCINFWKLPVNVHHGIHAPYIEAHIECVE